MVSTTDSESIPKTSELAQMTPMLRQYYELKDSAGDGVLFFRMGDFYEIFGRDAEEVAPLLDIVLTSRERGDKQRIPFCGVPHHSARGYWLKLLKAGYRIAIAEQVEDPQAAKGLVRREIVRMMSPGCIDELEGLPDDSPNYLAALYEDPKTSRWHLVVAEVSTGELSYEECGELAQALSLVEKNRPRELLVRRFCRQAIVDRLEGFMANNRLIFGDLPEAVLRDENMQAELLSQSLGSEIPAEAPARVIIAAVFSYLTTMKLSISQFLAVRRLCDQNDMELDEVAIRDLEIFETARRRTGEGSLFAQINYSLTPMGSRFLRRALLAPTRSEVLIQERHAHVEQILAMGETTQKKLREALKGMPDLERLSTRVKGLLATPVELARLRSALSKAKEVAALLDQRLQQGGPVRFGHRCMQALDTLNRALLPVPTALGTGAQVFASGFDPDLDECNRLASEGNAEIERYESQLLEVTGISSLKIKTHKTFGLLIEVTKANLRKVPESFIRKQTMVNCERYLTIELTELSERLLNAQMEAVQRENILYESLLQNLASFHDEVHALAQDVARFDFVQGLAWLAQSQDYVRPEVGGENLELRQCRHPVVEHYVGRHDFVPNDIVLPRDRSQLLITGPNMAGKSTVMRQAALCAILNQIGSFIPAKLARMPVFDRVFTRVGASDDLSRGHSTFMVEMSEAAQILRRATRSSLVILDEVGRGTSTEDGVAIASSILEDLVSRVGCYTLFATHYHELAEMASKFPQLQLGHTAVVEKDETVVFTHRLVQGVCSSSFGIEVARLAGVPDHVIDRAKQYVVAPISRTADDSHVPSPPKVATELFEEAADQGRVQANWLAFSKRLRKLQIERTTPLQAMNILDEIKGMFDALEQPGLFND